MQAHIAVIGGGYWGKNLVRNFYELGALKAVCDVNEVQLKKLQEQFPGIDIYTEVDSVLNENDIEGVVIAAPAAMHFALAKKALLAGKHVFVEKPLSLNVTEGEELVALAKKQGLTLMVGHLLHYHPAIQALKTLIKDGTLS